MIREDKTPTKSFLFVLLCDIDFMTGRTMFCSKNEIICSNSCLMTIITHISMLQFRYKMTFLGL